MDSPKCINCLNGGKIGQTYRISGSQTFRCHDCHTSYPWSSFDPIEMEWKSKPTEWKKFMTSKGVNVS